MTGMTNYFIGPMLRTLPTA